MLRTVRRLLVIAAVATTGVIASVGTAHASSSSAALTWSVTAVAAQPTTSIQGTGSALKFVPRSVTARHITGTCTATNYSFLILNKTRATQQVTYKGAAFGPPIPPKNGLLVCATGAIKGTFSLRADPLARLHFTIT